MKLICEIFRSPQKEEMYLYVEKAKGLVDVPETLLKQFGEAESVMPIVLTPERRLARVDVAEVLEHIEANGFFLQMPPTPQELLRRNRAND